MTRDDYPGLAQLLASRFHQDWLLDYGSSEAATASFARENTSVLLEAVVYELERLLQRSMADADLADLVVQLGAEYDAEARGESVTEWLQSVEAVLKQALTGAVAPSASIGGRPLGLAPATPAKRDLFTGQRRAWNAISLGLLRGHARAAVVHGPAGRGKSSLASSFGLNHRRAFPGGVHRFVAPREMSVDDLERALPSGERALVILDDAEFHPDLVSAVAHLLSRSRTLYFIVVSRRRDWVTQGIEALDVPVEALTARETRQLAVGWASADDVDLLHQQTDGNLLLLNLARDVLGRGLDIAAFGRLLERLVHAGMATPDRRQIGPEAPHARLIRERLGEVNRELKAASSESRWPPEYRAVSVLRQSGLELHQPWGGLGPDLNLFLVTSDQLGSFLIRIESDPTRGTEVGLIHSLSGVTRPDEASASMTYLHTFSSPVAETSEQVHRHVTLRDYMSVGSWLLVRIP